MEVATTAEYLVMQDYDKVPMIGIQHLDVAESPLEA
jgi:hypothetical protein